MIKEMAKSIANSWVFKKLDYQAVVRDWLPKLRGEELLIVNGYAFSGEHAYGPLTPATKTMLDLTGLVSTNFFAARKRLEEKGVITCLLYTSRCV